MNEQPEAGRWRTEDNRVWTWETKDPEHFAATIIDARRLAFHLNTLEANLAAERKANKVLDCGLGDFGHDAGESCKNDPERREGFYGKCISCRLTERSRALEAERDAHETTRLLVVDAVEARHRAEAGLAAERKARERADGLTTELTPKEGESPRRSGCAHERS